MLLVPFLWIHSLYANRFFFSWCCIIRKIFIKPGSWPYLWTYVTKKIACNSKTNWEPCSPKIHILVNVKWVTTSIIANNVYFCVNNGSGLGGLQIRRPYMVLDIDLGSLQQCCLRSFCIYQAQKLYLCIYKHVDYNNGSCVELHFSLNSLSLSPWHWFYLILDHNNGSCVKLHISLNSLWWDYLMLLFFFICYYSCVFLYVF